MLNTRLYLECDDCRNPFPSVGICPAPVDGAIYTVGMLREEAKAEGWLRRRFDRYGSVKDICSRCAKKKKKGGN